MGKRTDSRYIFVVENLAATNHTKSYAAGRANNTELLMLFPDFKVNSRLKNTQRNFQWNPRNALNEDA